VSHESADKATAHGNQTPAVDYFYTAATPRSRGALWTIFAPAFSVDYVNTARHKLRCFEVAMNQMRNDERATNAIGSALAFIEDMRADLIDLKIQWERVRRTEQTG
jgi:hypothetical protein